MPGNYHAIVASESVNTGAIMPFVSFKKHYKISIVIFCVMLILALPIASFKGKVIYSTTGVIHVSPRVANILQESKEQEIPSYQVFMNQQASTVGRYDIVFSALQKLGEKRFIWQLPNETDRRAAERLQAAMQIKAVKDTYLLAVSLESDKSQYLEEIVNAVIDTYLEEVRIDQNLYASAERLTFLYEQQDKLYNIINDKQKRLTEISHQLSVTYFVASAPSPYDKMLDESQQELAAAQRARMEAQANLDLFVNPTLGNDTEALEATVANIVYKDQGLQSLKANINERRSKWIEQISGLDPRHPRYEQIKKQLSVIEDELVEATNQLTQDIRNMLLEERRSKVILTKHIEDNLLQQIAEQKQRAAWFSQNYNEALIINQDIQRFYNQLQSVENRIGFIELESKAPGFIRIESYAKTPEIPARGGRKKIFIMVVMAGFIIGIIAPIAIDLMDRRIRTVGQIEKLIGYKPLAALMETNQEGISSAMLADQRRRLLLSLNRERMESGKNSYLIALTSVSQNSAVTSLAFDLANDCHRIHLPGIVVEVNAFKPDKRYLSDGCITLNDLLTDDAANLEQAITPGNGEYPDRIAIGLPAGSLMSGYQKLQTILSRLQEKYHFIFMDTAPILWSADTEYFAGCADITLLLIAAYQTQPGQITRTLSLLERLDPKAISFVVTRLLMFKGGGYYTKVFANSEFNNVITPHLEKKIKD